MKDSETLSRCSGKKQIIFHWFDGINLEGKDPIEVAVDRCFDAVDTEGRVWGPYNKAAIRAQFRRVLKDACRGILEPVDQVKEAGHDSAIPLYEIRWQRSIDVTERDPVTGEISHPAVLVRMYHSEPASKPEYFIGHHVHEKLIGSGDGATSRHQSQEIRIAQDKYRWGEDIDWLIVG